jgi:hypothetical protein
LTPELADRLASLPPLDRANARAAAVPCKICRHPAPFFDVVDLNKCAGFYAFGPAGVPVDYHRCDECGFLFTPFFDDWSEDDFRRFIYNLESADFSVIFWQPVPSAHSRESTARIAGRVR